MIQPRDPSEIVVDTETRARMAAQGWVSRGWLAEALHISPIVAGKVIQRLADDDVCGHAPYDRTRHAVYSKPERPASEQYGDWCLTTLKTLGRERHAAIEAGDLFALCQVAEKYRAAGMRNVYGGLMDRIRRMREGEVIEVY